MQRSFLAPYPARN